MSDPQQHQQQAATEPLPWFLRLFSSPALLANVVAFGAAILLLYTAAIEWPRRVDRFHESMQEQRDASREAAMLLRENQRLGLRIEQLEMKQQTQLEAIQKVLTELWFKLLAWEKGWGGGKKEEPGEDGED